MNKSHPSPSPAGAYTFVMSVLAMTLLAIFCHFPAAADTVSSTVTEAVAGGASIIDLSPLLQAAVASLAAVLSAGGGWIIKRLGDWIGLKRDDEMRKLLNDGLHRGIEFGAEWALRQGKDFASIKTRSEIVKEAAEYIAPKIPDTLAYFGLAPDDLSSMLEARLAGLDIAKDTAPLQLDDAAVAQ